MISSQIDRSRQDDRALTAGFGETGQEIITGDDGSAVVKCPQKFLEIFSAHWPAMLLFAKHYGVVEIKNDSSIGALQQTQLKLIKANHLNQHDHVVPGGFFQDAQALADTGTACGQDGYIDIELLVVIEAIAQTQSRARSVTMFYDAKSSHEISRCIFLQLPEASFQSLRSRRAQSEGLGRGATFTIEAPTSTSSV